MAGSGHAAPAISPRSSTLHRYIHNTTLLLCANLEMVMVYVRLNYGQFKAKGVSGHHCRASWNNHLGVPAGDKAQRVSGTGTAGPTQHHPGWDGSAPRGHILQHSKAVPAPHLCTPWLCSWCTNSLLLGRWVKLCSGDCIWVLSTQEAS